MTHTVIMADDHILIRNAIASLINTFPGFNVIHLAGNGTELIQAIEEGIIPSIVILDLSMPKMDGYETAKWLNAKHPGIKIIILTIFDSEIAMIRLLNVGVKGFLKKDIHPNDLKQAMISIAQDGFYYSHEITGKLGILFKKNNENQTSIEKAILSDADINFMKLACSELTYKEIAIKMKITPRAIDNFRDMLFDKLNIKSRVGLAIYAYKNGLVST